MLEPNVVYQAYQNAALIWRTSILREYLQLKTLSFMYGASQGADLVFMGGTAIHLFTGSPRFSEDLDFDNRGVTAGGLRRLADDVVRRFALEGVACEALVKERQGMTAVLRFTDILQKWGLTGHRDSVLRIKVDLEPQGFGATPERRLLSRLDVVAPILLTPPATLLAEKFTALLNRRRTMGRDLYDISWLLGQTKPDYAYLQSKLGVPDAEHLRQAVLEKLGTLNLASLRTDVLPFLPSAAEGDRITLFAELMRAALL
ncbi:MAG: nucleotidyl transferase AbiEii/AbiGii toxin family protein [Candidatus Cryosericum sp.]